MNDDVQTALPDEIFAQELETIEARREAAGVDSTTSVEANGPALRRGIVGLALSGGGIRSSTFSLGVIQSLAKRGLFKQFDYISSVSGGGYTGSMLSSLLNSPEIGHENLPLIMPAGEEESAEMQHLRNGSNYLSPGGFFETLRLPAIIIRGLLLNFLLILPWIMLLVVLTEYIHEDPFALDLNFDVLSGTALTILSALAGVGAYLLLSGIRYIPASWSVRNGYELSIAVVFLLIIGAVFAIPLAEVIDWAIQIPYQGLRDKVDAYSTHVTWSVAAVVFLTGFAIIKASEDLSAVASKVALLALGVAGPAGLFGIYLLLLVAQVDSPFLELDGEKVEFANCKIESGEAGRCQLNGKQLEVFKLKGVEYPNGLVDAYYCEAEDVLQIARPLASSIEFQNCKNVVATDGQGQPYMFTKDTYVLVFDEDRTELFGADLHLGGVASEQTLLSDGAFITLAVVLLILNLLFLDANRSSLHGFYRDRLSKLYLFKHGSGGEVEQTDELKLSSLNEANSVAPYHIINTTLNLQGSITASQRGRDGDFFFFSKHFCGGPQTGYCSTVEMEAADNHVNLGTAMAISAAAASPNMGSTTVRSLIFIMTMLNLRLGYWVPNPSFVRGGRVKYLKKPGSLYLLREAMGAPNAKLKFVNVSDGGHLENLAIWELVRRRCAIIVAIDGEADPDHSFNGLITLIRLARIDFGIRIEINLDELRLNDDRECRRHFAVGKIDYGEEGEGVLIYVKSSFIGDRIPFLQKYRMDNPDFPHETTADQFFDERQFEAYRALGEVIGERLTGGPNSVTDILEKR